MNMIRWNVIVFGITLGVSLAAWAADIDPGFIVRKETNSPVTLKYRIHIVESNSQKNYSMNIAKPSLDHSYTMRFRLPEKEPVLFSGKDQNN